MISKPQIDPEDSFNVGNPHYQDGTTIISTMSADTTNSSTSLNTTASSEDRAKKFEYPQVHADPAQDPSPSPSGTGAV